MEPLFIDIASTARAIGRSRSWFYANRIKLERIGFPRPHPLVKRYCAASVKKWVDSQRGLTDRSGDENPFDMAF